MRLYWENTSRFKFDVSVIVSVIKAAPQEAGRDVDKQDCDSWIVELS